MPGLAGIWTFGNGKDIKNSLQKMVQAMAYQPSYASQVYINEHLGLGIGRVSHRGALDDGPPIWNEARDICLVFSGEDYADPEELANLRSRGHRWEPGTIGYLVHFYEEIGPKFAEKLNGRFRGVIIDLRDQSVFLFNDRYGLSKVFIHQNKDATYFSSEAKAILGVLPELRQLDYTSLAETFSCGCVLQNRTLFTGISLLPGGSIWKFVPGQNPVKNSYFKAGSWESQESLDSAAYYEKLKETWIRILPRYLRDEGQVAVSLTGGKDSRMIMAWAQSPPGSLPCYTFGGMFRESQDVKLGRMIAAICRQPHYVIILGRDFFREFPHLAEQTVYLTDGAMDVSGAAELYVNKIARQIAPIRLTGNYGQEILHRAVAFKPSGFNAPLLDREFSRLVENVARTYEGEFTGNRLSFVAFKQVPWHHTSRLALELSQVILRSPYLDNDLVALSYRRPAGIVEDSAIQLRLIAEGNPELAKIGTDRALRYQEVPILTKILNLWQEFTFKAEYAYDYGMPQWLAPLDGFTRPLHIERRFLGRHKFNHFRVWYRGELSSYIKDVLLDQRTLRRPYLNGQRLEMIVKAHTEGRGNYTSEIHRLLTAELIQRHLIE